MSMSIHRERLSTDVLCSPTTWLTSRPAKCRWRIGSVSFTRPRFVTGGLVTDLSFFAVRYFDGRYPPQTSVRLTKRCRAQLASLSACCAQAVAISVQPLFDRRSVVV